MNNQRALAEQLFGEALDLPREERDAFLVKACRDAPAVKTLVEALLAENDRLTGFLSVPPYLQPGDTPPVTLAPGTQMGRYTIVEQLGSGGMGVVYRARDEKLERLVALKIVSKAVLTTEENRRHFRREAMALAKLNHPRIASMYDAGEQDGADFLVMELVQGQSLATKLCAGPLPVNEATAIARQIAEALGEAHERGVVHRDLKPANVMITTKGDVKVLDFGLAKLLAADGDAALSVAETRGLLGTPAYMSPEQALGNSVDARADLWGLGVLYFESLTGRRPFAGNSSLDVLHAVTAAPSPSIRALRPELPLLAEHIVNRSLEKDCDLRYQRAAEMETDLKRLARDLELGRASAVRIHTEPVSGTTAGAGPFRRQQAVEPVAAAKSHSKSASRKIWLAVGGVLAVAVAAVVWELSRPIPPPRVTNITQITNDGHQQIFTYMTILSYVTDGLRLYYSALVGNEVKFYQVSTQGGEPVSMSNLDGMAALDISTDHTKLLLINTKDNTLWTASVLGGPPIRLGDMTAGDASWSPNGDRIAYSPLAKGSELWVAESDGSGAHKLLTESGTVFGTRWSPDGRVIRFSVFSNGGSYMSEVSPDGTGQHRLFPEWKQTTYVNGRWTPDGRYFVFAKSSGQSLGRTEIWAARESGRRSQPSSRDLVRLTMGPLRADFPRISPDGKRIYFGGWVDRGELVRYDTKTDQWLPYLSGVAASHADFSRDGKSVVYTSYPESALWRSAVDGSKKLQLNSSSLQAMNPRWSPDGTQIAFNAHSPGEPWRMYVESAEGGGLRELASGECGRNGGSADPTWSPDGAYLVFDCTLDNGSSPLRIVDVRSGHVSVVPGTQGLWSPRWSPDGRYIAALSFPDPPKLVLYDVKTHERRVVFAPKGGAEWPAWSRDSLFVYVEIFNEQEYRVRIKDGKADRVADLTKLSFAPTEPNYDWVGLGPDGSLLATRNAGTNEEIYALDWNAP